MPLRRARLSPPLSLALSLPQHRRNNLRPSSRARSRDSFEPVVPPLASLGTPPLRPTRGFYTAAAAAAAHVYTSTHTHVHVSRLCAPR